MNNSIYANLVSTLKKIHAKYLVLMIFLVTMMQSCAFSEKQKAQKVIKEFLKENANDPNSYESLDIKVDSTNSYYYISSLHKELLSLIKEKKDLEQMEHDVKNEGDMARLWEGVDNIRFKRESKSYNAKKEKKINYNSKLMDLKGEIRRCHAGRCYFLGEYRTKHSC